MNDDELKHFEVVILNKDDVSFVDNDGIYKFFNGNWFEVSYGCAIYTKQVVH